MQVQRLSSMADVEPLAAQWNCLSQGVPFRSWPWLSLWWKHYGEQDRGSKRKDLFVLRISDEAGNVRGIAPWYIERSRTLGRVVRFLGSGEVCSDYLSLLCNHEDAQDVAKAIAQWLVEDAQREATNDSTDASENNWDLLQLSGIDAEDPAIKYLLEKFALRGAGLHHREAPRCWRVELPTSWDQYMAGLSKSHRKQIRRVERGELESSSVQVHHVHTGDQVQQAVDILIDLHQRRRESLGEAGCFSSSPFNAFQREVIPALFAAGQLRLTWIESEGKPIAAEYHLAGGGVIYAYQSGLDPQALDREPGRMAAIATIKGAMEEGANAIDFLRGDEPYKAHWRAEPRPMIDVHVVPGRTSARLRHSVLNASGNVKSWIKSGLELTGLRGA